MFTPSDLPQFTGDSQPEIFNLLKIGNYKVDETKLGIDLSARESEPKSHDPKTAFSAPKPSAIKVAFSSAYQKIKPYNGILIYPVVFIGSFLVFYSTMNFPSLAAAATGLFTRSQDQQQLGQDVAAYNQWISGYFYAVSNHDLLSPNNDYDHDGLTNYDEFVMKTNPTVADSDSDGVADGVEILNMTNPWGAGPLTSAQKKLISQIDQNMISERISFGVSAKDLGITPANSDSANFDLGKPGLLTIPKLSISAPLIFSPDPSAFDRDLEHGVIHYPGTALPGETGTMYVSGHSSDYIWKHDKFATIFTKINRLQPGDDIYVMVYGKDGKQYNFRYRVTGQKVYSPDDQTQFIDNSSAKLNLSTCWPIGTAQNRMVVSAQLSPL